MRDIVRELLSKNEWTFDEWSAALPENPTALLAAARLLTRAGQRARRTRCSTWSLDESSDRSRAPNRPDALTLAARAEAFALQSRWREAEQQYRLAIELIDDETIKRSWWFNLADIELRLDDESQRQAALRAAWPSPPATISPVAPPTFSGRTWPAPTRRSTGRQGKLIENINDFYSRR